MENKSSRSNARLAINITELQPASLFSSSKGNINTDDFLLIVEICGSFKAIPVLFIFDISHSIESFL